MRKEKNYTKTKKISSRKFVMATGGLGALVIIFITAIVLFPSDEEGGGASSGAIPGSGPGFTARKERVQTKKDIRPQVLSASTPLKKAQDNPVVRRAATADYDTVNHHEKEETQKRGLRSELKREFLEKLKSVPFRKIPDSPLYKVLHDDPRRDAPRHIPDKFQAALLKGKQNVFLKAVAGESWLTYRRDGGAIRQFLLEKDKSLMIRGDEILIFLGNVNALKIFLNNRPLQIKSQNRVKTLVFPQDKKSKYFIPLFVYDDEGKAISSDEAMKLLKKF